MKLAIFVAAGLVSVVSALAQISVKEPIPAVTQIDVDAGASGQAIPRTIFGTFLEPIGNSTYNGLWSELLRNPSFEAGLWSPQMQARMLSDDPELIRASNLALLIPWELLDERQGNRYEIHHGDAANSWRPLRVFAVPGAPTGIRLPTERWTHIFPRVSVTVPSI